METRVSLKQALLTQGFKGGSRGNTEWSQWVQTEKEQLAAVMEQHGIKWEQKGTHENICQYWTIKSKKEKKK